ncbi:hypothetical protein ACFL4E_03805 [Candidatus Omnitrophota bacterium]
MRKILTILIVATFSATTFFAYAGNAMDIYTFKKDRVDQNLEGGNRGYISGSPPPADKDRDLKRTLIGVDIELAGTADDDEDYVPSEKKEVKEYKKRPAVKKVTTEVREAPPVKEGAAKKREEKKKETEKDWIK